MKLARLLFWIGDQFERGVPDDRWELNRLETACYNISQAIYRCAWRVTQAPGK